MLNEERVESETRSHGQNVKFLREFFGIKHVSFAEMIGKPQSYVSTIESKETLEDDVLETCAEALGVTVKVLKELDPEKMVRSIIYNIDKVENSNGFNHISGDANFYPIEKIMELNQKNAELYERMLKTEQEKVTMLEKMLAERKTK